jgi:uracil DNA glycosylase
MSDGWKITTLLFFWWVYGSKHFSQVNVLLKQQGMNEIDWDLK